MLTEEPPVRSVSSKVKRFLNLFPGALWEGRKVGSSASFRDWGGIRGAGLGDETRGTSRPCIRENREEEKEQAELEKG